MFQIQTDVPMPSRRNRYPFEDMPSGGSFEIEGEEESRKVRNAAYQYAKKVNTENGLDKDAPGAIKFALRVVSKRDTGEVDAEGKAIVVKTYRLWRE